jgi:phage-related protein
MAGNASVGLRVFLDDALSNGLGMLNVNIGRFGVGLINLVSFAQQANSSLAPLLPLFAAVAGAGADFALFSGGLEDAVREASSLQDALVGVQISLSATDTQMGEVGQSVTQIADNSVFSTTEVAQEFERLGERSFTVQQILSGVGQASVNLAEAIHSETVPAADLLGRTMEVFGAKAGQAEYYASALTFAFYNGIPSASELASSIDQVGGMAAELNVPLNELIPTLDLLNKKGLSASDAATSLRYILQTLVDPTAKANQELAALGMQALNNATPAFRTFEAELASTGKRGLELVSNFDGTITGLQGLYNEAKRMGTLHTDESFQQWAEKLGMLNNKLFDGKGNFKDFYQILQNLGGALDRLNPEQRAQALGNLFNVRSGKGADLLLQNIDDTMRKLDQLSGKFNAFAGSNGAATDAAKRVGDFDGALKKFQTTVGSFAAQIGTPLLAPLTGFLNTLNNLFSSVSGGGSKVSTFGSSFLVVGTVLSGIALIGLIAAGVFLLFGGALAPIVGVVLAVAGGVILLSGAIAVVVSLFVSANKQGSPLNFLLDSLHRIITTTGQAIDQLFSPAIGALKDAWRQLQEAVKPLMPLLGFIGAIIGGVLVGAITGLMSVIGPLANGLGHILAGAMLIVAGAINVVVGVVKFIWGLLVTFFDLLTGKPKEAQKALQGAMAGIGQALQGVWQIIQGLLHAILGLFQAVFGAIAGFVMGFVRGIISFFQHLFDTLVGHSIIPDLVKSILSWIGSLPGKAGELIKNFVGAIIDGAKSLGGFFHDHVIQPLLDKLHGLLGSLVELGGNIIKNLAEGIINGIGNFLGGAMNAVGNFIKDHLPHSPAKRGPLTQLHQQGAEIPNQIALGIHSNVGVLGSAVVRMGNILSPQTFGHPSSSFAGPGSGGGGNTSTINLNLDGKVVASCVLDHTTNTLKMNGMGRTFK